MRRKLLAATLLLTFLCGCAPDDAAPGTTTRTDATTTTGASTTDATRPAYTTEADAPTTTEPASPPDDELLQKRADALASGMSLEQQVRQLFIVTLSGPDDELGQRYFSAACDGALTLIQEGRPGGFVLFPDNITTRQQTADFMLWIQAVAATPMLIGIDEEGGQVSRLGSAESLGYEPTPSALELALAGMPETQDDDDDDDDNDDDDEHTPDDATDITEAPGYSTDPAFGAGAHIGNMLSSMNINLNFAPVCDVLTEQKNSAIGDRSFGGDAAVVADMAAAFALGLRSEGLLSCAKHFPGLGAASTDTHTGRTIIEADAATLRAVDYPPFERAVHEGADFIMVGHATYPNVDDSGLPASLSPYFVTDVLRGRMSYEGVIITDALNMDALAQYYRQDDAAVLALEAGVDMLLMPPDYEAAVQSVLAAVESGRLKRSRIRESVSRILYAKLSGGIIPFE